MSDSGRKRVEVPGAIVERGIVCKKCGCAHFKTRNTIRSVGGVVRYKVCRHCGHIVRTYER